jgi:hypothetical protein
MIFLLHISNLVPLWSENIVSIVWILLNLLRLKVQYIILSFLVNVSRELEKDVQSVDVLNSL